MAGPYRRPLNDRPPNGWPVLATTVTNVKNDTLFSPPERGLLSSIRRRIRAPHGAVHAVYGAVPPGRVSRERIRTISLTLLAEHKIIVITGATRRIPEFNKRSTRVVIGAIDELAYLGTTFYLRRTRSAPRIRRYAVVIYSHTIVRSDPSRRCRP